jgi:hypothetical protein
VVNGATASSNYTKDFPITVSAVADKAVLVSAQDNLMLAGTYNTPDSRAIFNVSVMGIGDGSDYAIVSGLPAGVELYDYGIVTISSGKCVLRIDAKLTPATIEGTHSLTLTIDGVTSDPFTFTISPFSAGTKSVWTGAQDTPVIAGTGKEVGFPVSLTNIANGATGTIQWYSDAAGTITTTAPSLGNIEIYNVLSNAAAVVFTTTASTPGGTYYFRLTYDGTQSNVGTLAVKSVSVGAQNGTMNAGSAGTVSYNVTTKGIANGTYFTASSSQLSVSNLPANVSISGGYLNVSNGSGTLYLYGSSAITAGTTSTLRLTVDGAQSAAFTITISAPEPTGISFANSTIYTWYGNTVDLGMTVTPAGSDRSRITWTQTGYDISGGGISAVNISSSGTGSAATNIIGAGMGLLSQSGYTVTLTARLPNGNSASVALRTKFKMAVYSSINPILGYNNQYWFNSDGSWSFVRGSRTAYVRAYYGANETEWEVGNNLSAHNYLTMLHNTRYTITSSDPDLTVERHATHDQTWTLSRTGNSVLKAVNLTITVGSQTYTQVVNLVD